MSKRDDLINEIVIQIELHSPGGIQKCFANGLSPNETYNGEPLIYELTSEYTRSSRFKECVRLFVNNGLNFPDPALLAVLSDDVLLLEEEIRKDSGTVFKLRTLRCAYTPLTETTLLHICAEFNHVSCARILINHGADINAIAGFDKDGFGGQTPIFHTVNQNGHQSKEMLHFLLSHNADLAITVKGIIWGKNYEWETLIPSVNPVSYTMMGLLPQMHRDEGVINAVVSLLMKYKYGIDYTPQNIPNKYLGR